MSKRSLIIRHSSVVLAVAASVGIMGIAPASAAMPSAVETTPAVTTVPDAPVIVLATSGNAAATANWAPPTNDGGSPLT